MVRFVKNGSDATAAAIRVARAFTGREHVACCGYHGWQDWYIGSTTRSAGVPQAVRALTHPFAYNDPEALEKVLTAQEKIYQRELELLSESGLSPADVVRAATLNNARYFRIEDRLGSIEPGKLADLVLIEGDPFKDSGAFRQVKRVMLNGQWVF